MKDSGRRLENPRMQPHLHTQVTEQRIITMPIYEYQCRNCQHRLEKLQKISDPPLVTCPACGQDALKKLVSAAAFRLKGRRLV